METLHRDRRRYLQIAQKTSYFFESDPLRFRPDPITKLAVRDMPVANHVANGDMRQVYLELFAEFSTTDSPG